MVGGRDALGPLHPVGVLEQRDDVAGAGLFDRVVQARQRADVNHCGFADMSCSSRLYGDEF